MNEPVIYGERLAAQMKRKRRGNLVMCAVLFCASIVGLVESIHAIKTGGTITNRVGGIEYSGWEGAAMFLGAMIVLGVGFVFMLRDRS